MDFTEIYKQSTSLVAFSPGAHFILTAVHQRLIVRRTDSFQISRTWLLDASPSPTHAALTTSKSRIIASNTNHLSDPPISHVGWSCDSEYILAACTKHGVVHLLKLQDEEWSGRIDSGAEGDQCFPFCLFLSHRFFRSCQGRMGPRWAVRALFLRMGCEYSVQHLSLSFVGN